MKIVTMTERVDPQLTPEGAPSARAQASFAAALRDFEQSAAAMLDMPHVKAPLQEHSPAQLEPGPEGRSVLLRHATANPRAVAAPEAVPAATRTNGTRTGALQAGTERSTANTADTAAPATTATLVPVSPGAQHAATAAVDVTPSACSQVAGASAGDAAIGSAGTRAALAHEGMQRVHLAAIDGQHSPVLPTRPAAKDGLAGTASVGESSAVRNAGQAETRTAPAMLAAAQVIAHVAADRVAVAVRAALLDVNAERELLARMAAELGASRIGRYSIQLNGLSVTGPTEKGGQ